MEKICGNCGAKMNDEDYVCGVCGSGRSAEESSAAETCGRDPSDTACDENPGAYPPGQDRDSDTGCFAGPEESGGFGDDMEMPGAPRRSKLLLAVILTAAVILAAVIAYAATQPAVIHLNKYLTINAAGYNGYGTAAAEFDEAAFESDWGDKLSYQGDAAEFLYLMIFPADYMEQACIGGTLDRTSGLSNGDKITYSWDCDDSAVKSAFGVRLQYSDISKKVENLETAETFDPFDYVDVTFSGCDHYGSVSIDVDTRNEYMREFDFVCKGEENGTLSNGEEITLAAESRCPDEPEKYFTATYGAVPAAEEKTYVVSGLKEAEPFDPFDYVDVTFSGVSPTGTASVTVDSSKACMEGINALLSADSLLSNGDTVTVSLSFGNGYSGSSLAEYWAYNYGCTPVSLEKIYTVEGLGRYVTSTDEISESALASMISQAQDAYYAYAAGHWVAPETLHSVNFLGIYLLTPKDGFHTSCQNICFLAFSVDIVDERAAEGEEDGSMTYYSYTRYDNLTLENDGSTSVDLAAYTTPSEEFSACLYNYTPNALYYYGYRSMSELFNHCVVQNMDNYTYESTVAED